ncbi:MAG TPA: hypothetical protein VFX15_12745 [Actinomycetes bacterium]|nr:hypothetical protein [Actinomycetes bacterium]
MIGRALRTTAPFGLAAGTLYFVIIGLTSTLFTVFGVEGLSAFQLVLFIGVGAALGLALGAVVGIALGTGIRAGRPASQQRVAGALLGGAPVLVLTLVEYVTGAIGVLAQDITTVVVIPTAVATIGSAALAPNLTPSG